jgi:cytoskeletal protein CcmA (bactofilin family)
VSDYGFLDYCVFGENEVEIGEESNIQCNIGSNGDVVIEEGSTITGNIVSGGNITLEEDVTVIGDVTAVGSVTLEEGALVTGSTAEWTSSASITGPIPNYNVTITITDADGNETTETLFVDGGPLPLTFTLAAGGANIYIDPDEIYPMLPPGSYGTLQVGQNATLNLISGSYAFNEVSIDEDATVNLMVTGGNPIVLDVVNDLEFEENVTMVVIGGTAADIAIRVQSGAEFDEQGQYLGTYFALRSSGDELEPGENTTLNGGLYGMDVEVDEETTISGMPSVDAYLAFFGL